MAPCVGPGLVRPCEVVSVPLGLAWRPRSQTLVEFTDHSFWSSLRGRHLAVEERKVLAFLPPAWLTRGHLEMARAGF